MCQHRQWKFSSSWKLSNIGRELCYIPFAHHVESAGEDRVMEYSYLWRVPRAACSASPARTLLGIFCNRITTHQDWKIIHMDALYFHRTRFPVHICILVLYESIGGKHCHYLQARNLLRRTMSAQQSCFGFDVNDCQRMFLLLHRSLREILSRDFVRLRLIELLVFARSLLPECMIKAKSTAEVIFQ